MKSIWLVWAGTVLVWNQKKGILPGILMIATSLLVIVDAIRGIIGSDDEEDE